LLLGIGFSSCLSREVGGGGASGAVAMCSVIIPFPFQPPARVSAYFVAVVEEKRKEEKKKTPRGMCVANKKEENEVRKGRMTITTTVILYYIDERKEAEGEGEDK